MALTILIAALAVCGVFLIAWCVIEALFCTFPKNSCHIFYLQGETESVEQEMRSALWVCEKRGMSGKLIFVDCGISPQAQETAQLILKNRTAAVLCAPSQISDYLGWENGTSGAGTDQRHDCGGDFL